MNNMQQPRIEKVTLNIGAGKDQARLDKGMIVLKALTGIDPLKTVTNKRIAQWGLRPGLPIGCKLTLRKTPAKNLLRRLLKAKEFALLPNNFDDNGSISFGIQEYIDIEGAVYDPKIGILGLQVCVTLEKPGYRVKRRSIKPGVVGKAQRVTKQDAMNFLNKEYGVKVGGSA